MNPTFQTPDEPKKIIVNSAPGVDPATFIPQESSPEADLLALEAIGVLEAEEGTSKVIHPQEEAPTLADIPEPVAIEEKEPDTTFEDTATPLISPELVQPPQPAPELIIVDSTAPESLPLSASTDIAGALKEEAFQVNANPFPKQKKSSKKLIIISLAAIVLIGGLLAGYFVWQSMNTEDTTETSQNATGDQPGGIIVTDTTDTEASVNEAADALAGDSEAIVDTTYSDSSLSDTTLYEN